MHDDWVLPLKNSKYAGEPLADIPVEYLDWLLGQDWVWKSTQTKIKEHLETSRASEWNALAEEDSSSVTTAPEKFYDWKKDEYVDAAEYARRFPKK